MRESTFSYLGYSRRNYYRIKVGIRESSLANLC